jgi:hypothetical protein
MVIQLSNGIYVAADQIASIKSSYYNKYAIVTLKDGSIYEHYPQLYESVYEAIEKLVLKINGLE